MVVMQHLHVDLSGCATVEEAEAAAALIDAAQSFDLQHYEAAMIDAGVDRARIAAELQSYRRELVQLRAAALKRLKGMLAQRGCETLQ
jgi:hypothetical protein